MTEDSKCTHTHTHTHTQRWTHIHTQSHTHTQSHKYTHTNRWTDRPTNVQSHKDAYTITKQKETDFKTHPIQLDSLSSQRILVDCDDVSVEKNGLGLWCDSAEVNRHEERRSQHGPHSKLRLLLVVTQPIVAHQQLQQQLVDTECLVNCDGNINARNTEKKHVTDNNLSICMVVNCVQPFQGHTRTTIHSNRYPHTCTLY